MRSTPRFAPELTQNRSRCQPTVALPSRGCFPAQTTSPTTVWQSTCVRRISPEIATSSDRTCQAAILRTIRSSGHPVSSSTSALGLSKRLWSTRIRFRSSVSRHGRAEKRVAHMVAIPGGGSSFGRVRSSARRSPARDASSPVRRLASASSSAGVTPRSSRATPPTSSRSTRSTTLASLPPVFTPPGRRNAPRRLMTVFATPRRQLSRRSPGHTRSTLGSEKRLQLLREPRSRVGRRSALSARLA